MVPTRLALLPHGSGHLLYGVKGQEDDMHVYIYIYIYIYCSVCQLRQIVLEPNTPECIGSGSHEMYVCTPLVGHTCTVRLLNDIAVPYD